MPADQYVPGHRRPVLARVGGRWRPGQLVAWYRPDRRTSWTAMTLWLTGPPVWSTRFDVLPVGDVRSADPCEQCSAWQLALQLRYPGLEPGSDQAAGAAVPQQRSARATGTT